jgi:hypothetical protein
LDGSEVRDKGPIFINGRVNAGLKGVMGGHDRDIIHEDTMHDFVRPRSLLRLREHREKIEF